MNHITVHLLKLLIHLSDKIKLFSTVFRTFEVGYSLIGRLCGTVKVISQDVIPYMWALLFSATHFPQNFQNYVNILINRITLSAPQATVGYIKY